MSGTSETVLGVFKAPGARRFQPRGTLTTPLDHEAGWYGGVCGFSTTLRPKSLPGIAVMIPGGEVIPAEL